MILLASAHANPVFTMHVGPLHVRRSKQNPNQLNTLALKGMPTCTGSRRACWRRWARERAVQRKVNGVQSSRFRFLLAASARTRRQPSMRNRIDRHSLIAERIFAGPMDSPALHNKLWVTEDDTRTSLACPPGASSCVADIFPFNLPFCPFPPLSHSSARLSRPRVGRPFLSTLFWCHPFALPLCPPCQSRKRRTDRWQNQLNARACADFITPFFQHPFLSSSQPGGRRADRV